MEPVGLAVGVISLFDVCITISKGISDAKSHSEDLNHLTTLFELERQRIQEIEGSLPQNTTLAIQPTSPNQTASQNDSRKQVALQMVKALLEEAVTLMNKYGAQPFTQPSSRLSWTKLNIVHRMSKRLKPIKWAAVDKRKMEEICGKLKQLNDLLWSLAQSPLIHLQLGFHANQILTSGPERLREIHAAAGHAGYNSLQRAASVKLASLGQDIKSLDRSSTLSGGSNTIPVKSGLDYSDITIKGTCGSSGYMVGFMESKSTPVLIERRSAFQTTTMHAAAVDRLNRLVNVLQSMCAQPLEINDDKKSHTGVMTFGILRCLGWITPEHGDFQEIDLVFSYPPNTSGSPASLYSYLRKRRTIPPGKVSPAWSQPSLGSRFTLALNIAGIYANFMTVGYLHRGINSHNLFFFMDNIHQPYLAGVAEARPEKIPQHSSQLSKGDMGRDLYWPWDYVVKQADPNSVTEPWNTANDLYGLGVVLVEIGHWCTASQIRGHRGSRDFHVDLLPQAVDKLEFNMGKIYKNVVLMCLNAKSASSIDMYQEYSNKILRPLELCSA